MTSRHSVAAAASCLRLSSSFYAPYRRRWPSSFSSAAAAAAAAFDGPKARARRRPSMIRLSKRMSELDLCSRREADRLIESGRVLVRGVPVTPILGIKVDADETDVSVSLLRPPPPSDDSHDEVEVQEEGGDRYLLRPGRVSFDWDRIRGDTVVLHKPLGFVSGQPERVDKDRRRRHRHPPAVKLLTRCNFHAGGGEGGKYDNDVQETLSRGVHLHFARRRSFDEDFHGRRPSGTTLPDESEDGFRKDEATLTGYAPAGRLDLDSTGLLLFTRCGVTAKKLVGPRSDVEKEYIAFVEPARYVTPMERELGLDRLPPPTSDLRSLLRGGRWLRGDRRPLRPVVEAEWLGKDEGGDGTASGERRERDGQTLRLVLREGRKHQVRRMCREILGLHVVSLERTRVGGIRLDDLPVGKWRPLREEEARSILFSSEKKEEIAQRRRPRN